MLISKVGLPVLSLYRSEKDGENIEIIVENTLIKGLKINLECVIITFNLRFSEFNVCCGQRTILMHWALIPTLGRNKH